MDPNTILFIAVAVYLLSAVGMFACVKLSARDEAREHEAMQERACRSELYPYSGLVSAAVRTYAAADESDLERAQAFVWALDRIDRSAPDLDAQERWELATGQGRN